MRNIYLICITAACVAISGEVLSQDNTYTTENDNIPDTERSEPVPVYDAETVKQLHEKSEKAHLDSLEIEARDTKERAKEARKAELDARKALKAEKKALKARKRADKLARKALRD